MDVAAKVMLGAQRLRHPHQVPYRVVRTACDTRRQEQACIRAVDRIIAARRLGWPKGLDKKLRDAVCFYTTIILSVAIAVLIDFLKIDPIQSLFWSAIVNGVLAPFLLVGILLSARDTRIMKKQPSSVAAQAIVGVTTLAMFGAAGVMFWSILQGG